MLPSAPTRYPRVRGMTAASLTASRTNLSVATSSVSSRIAKDCFGEVHLVHWSKLSLHTATRENAAFVFLVVLVHCGGGDGNAVPPLHTAR